MARPRPALPSLPLVTQPSPVHELARLRARVGGPRLLAKRDDTIGFAFGGNKVRKIAYLAAAALAEGADTLITCGGVQSNHARVTAVTAAVLGLRCVLVVNGAPPDNATANALLDRLAGAEIRHVPSRDARDQAMLEAADEVRRAGGRPFVIPLGASVPLGAAAFGAAIDELLAHIDPPDLIGHPASYGGSQAGLVAGCARAGVATRVLGISADEAAGALTAMVTRLLGGLEPLLGEDAGTLASRPVDVDDRFVGEGYGIPTEASDAAIELLARTEGLFLDPVYTAKAMAGLLALLRDNALPAARTVVFWHTGGQVALFS
jgi:1-aminocyclopropane-1-carboxylate deaminase/D-cysteine desulfhydrase-like pyridoxal-dependent ACC family enzyme